MIWKTKGRIFCLFASDWVLLYEWRNGFFVQPLDIICMQKGRLFIYQLMKTDGHLPIMEQDW